METNQGSPLRLFGSKKANVSVRVLCTYLVGFPCRTVRTDDLLLHLRIIRRVLARRTPQRRTRQIHRPGPLPAGPRRKRHRPYETKP